MRLSAALLITIASSVAAQGPIPLRTVGPVLATSTENVGQAVTNLDCHGLRLLKSNG